MYGERSRPPGAAEQGRPAGASNWRRARGSQHHGRPPGGQERGRRMGGPQQGRPVGAPEWRRPAGRAQGQGQIFPRDVLVVEDFDERNRDENQRESRDNNRYNRNRNDRPLGFTELQEISLSNVNDIISRVNDSKTRFMKLLEVPVDAKKLDLFPLILTTLAKVCQSPFQEFKVKLILEICNSSFIGNFRNYLMDLPYAESGNNRKHRNRLYWENQQEFWDNFLTFCECILDISPATALQKCRSLFENTSRSCLDGLNERHSFDLTAAQGAKLAQLRDRLLTTEEENLAATTAAAEAKRRGPVDLGEPPEDFRQLSVLPTREDLLQRRPFLRPNIIAGRYQDVEHYLDVQFRLLREDCFGPLREGIHQFIEDPNKKKFDNIRVYRNVMFVGPYVSKTNIGSVVQLDEKTVKRFKRINWSHSKQFIYGSLLLFTKDNFKSFLIATILERDIKLLSIGRIPVSMVNMDDTNLFDGGLYFMIESQVYYEPYQHILKALQDPKFPQHLAMKEYIVDVEPIQEPPSYLSPGAMYAVHTGPFESTKFVVLQDETWPTKEQLSLNYSQYEAYKLALTHEFAVIQGPPGTGKTFLAIKVATTIIKNLNINNGCLMLVICYTNHALDQFLEGLLPVTNSIVRIGGQSRSEAMTKINLTTLRRNHEFSGRENKLYMEQRHNLRRAVSDLQNTRYHLESLNTGVISYKSLSALVPESQILGQHYTRNKPDVKSDPIKHWLFENMELVKIQDINSEETNEEEYNDIMPDVDENDDGRIAAILDDFEDFMHIDDFIVTTTFTISDTEKQIQSLRLLYNKIEDRQKKNEIKQNIIDLHSRIKLFSRMANEQHTFILNGNDLSRLPMKDRWALYFTWVNTIRDDLKSRLQPLKEDAERAERAYEEARMMNDWRMLRGTKVIGMTTSGAARLRKLLQALGPPIVIVEEAAEVLEQHIVTSLTKYCKHLVLIGDHQQLRPSAADVRLARHFNLEISLFERMIRNGMHSRRLSVQHRMRPELAKLIVPHIYPELQNHPSVEAFPAVRGVANNLFFLTHDFKEQQMDDASSRSNQEEADTALGLANYLMQQDYQDGDVTILAAYSGQMFYMRKQRERYRHLSKVKITVVDNYQGEESKIIILSLVRNNKENKIGFLGTENRVCVALSRAREGFYILGNIEILKNNSDLWKKIGTTLELNASLGTSLMLKCVNHPSEISTISCAKDFEKAPEGGCMLKCNYSLPCGHNCPRVCHAHDRGHTKTKCFLPCERVLCELGHVCPSACWVNCKPCVQLVEKLLPCGHRKRVHCHVDPADPAIKCLFPVKVTLPDCGHETNKSCWCAVALVKCPRPCERRVESCGHQCRRTCHVTDDPDHELYACEKPCARAKAGCSAAAPAAPAHRCERMCHETCDPCTVLVTKKRNSCTHTERVECNKGLDAKPCLRNCNRMLPCQHHCKKQCYEQCGDCQQKVSKAIPECGHSVVVSCGVAPSQLQCGAACERALPCGHRCARRCRESCDAAACTAPADRPLLAPCGHMVFPPCNVYRALHTEPVDLSLYCVAACGAALACGHPCAGSCARCRRGRVHAPCESDCGRTHICGHECKEPCNNVCPPCARPCGIRCEHTQCAKSCGEPCIPCTEPCSRGCPHGGTCSRLCGQPCSRAACSEPCPASLRCGHRCRGLCGEPCPDICKTCRPDDFPTDFLGDDFEDDDLFITLQDCNHVLDVENMDNLMTGDTETVTIRSCPFCRTPIINTYRYKDLVNNMIKTAINPIKEKVYGNQATIKDKREEILCRSQKFQDENMNVLEANTNIKKAFKKLHTQISQKKKVSLLSLNMLLLYLELLEEMVERYKKFTANNLIEVQKELLNVVEIICAALVQNSHKISEQMQMDIHNELKRMNSIIQLSKLMTHPSYLSSRMEAKIVAASKIATDAVLTGGIFNEVAAVIAMKKLEEAVKVFGVVSKEERDMVVKAIGSKAGSWYSCPNGHYYSIADCGGATVESRCADCGAAIGGRSHCLRDDNRHAGELDGSRHPAWSNHNDDMANFQFE